MSPIGLAVAVLSVIPEGDLRLPLPVPDRRHRSRPVLILQFPDRFLLVTHYSLLAPYKSVSSLQIARKQSKSHITKAPFFRKTWRFSSLPSDTINTDHKKAPARAGASRFNPGKQNLKQIRQYCEGPKDPLYTSMVRSPMCAAEKSLRAESPTYNSLRHR